MRFHTARQAWHDAFDCQAAESDYAAMVAGTTDRSRTKRRAYDTITDDEGKVTASALVPTTCAVETRVGKGSAGRIMDAVEKGLIQSAIAQLRRTDPLAYWWGMVAYAPPANRFRERRGLVRYLMRQFDAWEEPHDQVQVGQLALYCVHACALRDVNGRRIERNNARRLLGCDKEAWDRDWRRIWVRLERLLDPLPVRALGPVYQVVQGYRERIARQNEWLALEEALR